MRVRTLLIVLAATTLAAIMGLRYFISMPGPKHKGPLPPITAEQRSFAEALRHDVEQVAGTIGERNLRRPATLARARDYLASELKAMGYTVSSQPYSCDGDRVENLEVELRGASRPDEIVIIGAHYDSVSGSPGANDNGSGVAAVLELARRAQRRSHARTVRFVLFVNEEPPYFQSEQMGSWQYAARCRARKENITAMLSLETIGYYSDEPNSQHYPSEIGALYPKTGNFIGFVANVGSASLLRHAVDVYRRHSSVPAEGAAAPEAIPGVGWSDQWPFWKHGYHALMVTDTAPFRYPWYHTAQDTPDKLDYERMARVVLGIEAVIDDLVNR